MKDIVSKYRQAIKPPYSKKDYPLIGATLLIFLAVVALIMGLPNRYKTQEDKRADAAGPALTVSGNHIVDSSGNVVVLRGVTRWSLEFNCSDGHFNLSDFQAIRSWGANSVRITLNSNFWLNGFTGNCTSAQYQSTVKNAVSNAEAAGLRPILVLQWTGNRLNGGRGGQEPMPPRDALIFWQQLASYYANDPLVMFSAYAEPHDSSSWSVWLNGDSTYAGMQEIVNTISQAAPGHIIFVSGESWAKNLDFVLNGHKVQGQNIVLEVHPYGYYSNYINQWQGIQPNYPIVNGEAGIDSSGDTLDTQLQTFESWQTGYFGWAWTDTDNHSLLNSGGYDGGIPRSDPPQFGVRFRDFMLKNSQINGGFLTPTLSPTITSSIPTTIPTTTTIPPTATNTPSQTPTATPTPLSTDATSPTVSLNSPIGGTVATKSTVNIVATASDNIRVVRVDFRINGTIICTDTGSPYGCSWKVPAAKNKTYTIQAIAVDAAGNSSTTSINVTAR